MTNAFGRGLIKISDEGTFKAVKKLHVKRGTDWKDAKTAWVKQNGQWIQVYPTPKGQITFNPPTLNFEAANGYESPTQYVSITNTGDENVIIEDFSVSYTAAGKFVTFFDLTELGGALPATIAPGETKRLGIAIDAGSGAAFVQQDVVTIVDTPTLKTVNILNTLPAIDVDYLVVAGGGGGGSGTLAAGYGPGGYTIMPNYLYPPRGNGGGGGGGGVAIGYKKSIKRGESVNVTVGQGGAGGVSNNVGRNGGNSSFGDIVTIGGGGGAGTNGAGQPGASGGGGAFGGKGGAGTSGQGFPGSNSTAVSRVYGAGYYTTTWGGGQAAGGGGAGGANGSGRISTLTGIRQYYGGGGGTGGVLGTANTGIGGGGGISGAAGGSGVVIVKYDYDKQLGSGGIVTTYTTDDGVKHWVHTFTQNGTFTYNEVAETVQITVIEQVATTTQQLGLTNAGELGSSESTIRIKTNVGAFGTQYTDYTIFGEVTPPYAEADILPGLNFDLEYFRYNPRQTRAEVQVTNIGNGSLIITGIEGVGQYFNVISYPDAIAPGQYGLVIIESRVDDNVQPGIYTDVITIKSNHIGGDINLNMTLDVMFPEGNTRISTAGIGKFIVPEGVYRLSEVRVIGGGGGGGQGFNQQAIPRIPNPNPSIGINYSITGSGSVRPSRGSIGLAANGSITVFQGELVTVIVGSGGSNSVAISYQNAKRVGSGGTVSSYLSDGLQYWVHTFTLSGAFTFVGVDPVLSGGVNAAPVIIPGSGSGGGGGSGSIVLVANVDVMPGEVIEYVVGRGGAGVAPVLSTTNPAPAGKPGETTSFKNGLVAAGGGLGGGGGGPNTGGVGAGNTPNPRITGVGLVPRTLSWAWSGHMNTYAVWDNYSDAANAWYTVRKFEPTYTDSYTFHLSCDNYGVLYLNGPAILSTTSFGSVTRTTVPIQKDTVNIIGMYAQNWGGPCGYALHVTDSAGRVVWDTRTYRAAETIESLPGAVSRRGGQGQNGTAGIGNGGHGGSNTFGLGGVPGLYSAPMLADKAGGPGRGPGTGGGGGPSGIDGQITPASGPGADGEVFIAWGPIVPRDPPANLIAHFVVSIEEQRMYDRVLPYCNPYVMQVSGFFTEKNRPYALFNGSSANYIGTPSDAKYDLVRAANLSFTIEAWVILRGAGQYPYYGGEIINRDAEYEVAISQNDQIIVAIDWGVGTDVNLPGSGWIIPPAGVAVVPRNVPTHVAVVANQSTLLIYINGNLVYTTPLNRVARRDNTPVWIGNRPGQSQGFNGGIGDLRIWNVARTQAQIQANMTGLNYNTPQGI